ncbi:AfsA-related hotdog domain-containing protein [Streptomyces hiroshimensis]|uniref:A-factor biosynthesis hotdog domain-containing protein n=1 Tax=Streptomyces hiroshimensis TaxID=66424 RepID=A0ABQ2Z563_9ACTN|nr:AfsA-related hotdog domain-containing protein [Streptomyces hiroshimensis]GGY05423.1 hypothetical protein GCM10010324_60210 [Streptomyces hiroshimensis]
MGTETAPTAPAPATSPFLGPHHLVHRPDTPEAFALDSASPVRQDFVFAAELPEDHPLFSDHSAPFHDLLFPVEALRQAALFAARHYFGVPAHRRIAVASCGVEVGDIRPWRRTGGAAAFSLGLALTPHDVVGGVPRRMVCRGTMAVDGVPCGTAEATLLFVMPGVYRKHRAQGRRDSDRVPASLPVASGAPAPGQVGRRSARNVVIGRPLARREQGLVLPVDALAARAALPGEPGEVPPALFLEASRQSALLAAAAIYGFSPDHALVTRWDASFRGFAEPDLPLACTVSRTARRGVRPVRDEAGRPVVDLRIGFVQGGRSVARASATVLQDC